MPLPPSMATSAVPLLLGLLCAPVIVSAQTSAVVDEGTFMVTRNGAPMGRESFRIVRAPGPGGQAFLATGRSASGMSTRLGTDSSGVPISYESDLVRGAEVIQRLRGQGRPGRFSVLVQTKTGEAGREYLLSNGALLVDDDVFHHFYFVHVAAGKREQLVVISPRAGQQERFQLEERANDTVDIGGRSIRSRHYALTDTRGASAEVWVDAQGRLLKVSIPRTGLLAFRDDPPR